LDNYPKSQSTFLGVNSRQVNQERLLSQAMNRFLSSAPARERWLGHKKRPVAKVYRQPLPWRRMDGEWL